VTKKLFIFDLDGVLVDACDWHRNALNHKPEKNFERYYAQIKQFAKI